MSGAQSAPPLPLDGVKVIDFTQIMLGPVCTQMLGDYGADVIKIERPGTGDLSRTSIGADPDGLNNPVFSSLNRNKRSIVLDLKTDVGRDRLTRLIAQGDVVVSNFRPEVMDRMGFGYEALRAINPRIIFAYGTGFGPNGPYAHKGGQDIIAQAMTGLMRRTAPGAPVSIFPTALADYSAGMHLVQGILLALMQREKTGVGQVVYVSLYNSLLAMQMQEAAFHMMRGRDFNWAAMPLVGTFQTTDGALVLVGAFRPHPLRDICAALAIPDLSAEPRFATMEEQRKHRAELQGIFADRFRSNTTAYWIDRLEGEDLLCAPVRELGEALADPQTAINRMIFDLGTTKSGGPLKLVGSPIAMSNVPVSVRHPPPHLNEHEAEILRELGVRQERSR
jgi:formyl-CoA transferase